MLYAIVSCEQAFIAFTALAADIAAGQNIIPIRVSELQADKWISLFEPSVDLHANKELKIGIVHCRPESSHIGRLKQVATWYALLGFEFSEQLHEQMRAYDLVLPSYHPSVLRSIQHRPLFFPLAHAFWTKSCHFQQLIDEPSEDANHALITWLQKLKQAEGKIAFTQQVLLEQFEHIR